MSIFKELLKMNDLERKQAIINFDFLTSSYNNLRELRRETYDIIMRYIEHAYSDSADKNVTEVTIPKDDAAIFFKKMLEIEVLEKSLFSKKVESAGKTEFTYYAWFGPVEIILEGL